MSELAAVPVTTLKGVGAALAEKLARVGLENLQDLLFHLPLRYQDRTRITPIGALRPGQDAVVEIRAWDNHGGTITTWDTAIIKGNSAQLFVQDLGGVDPVSGNFYLTPNLVGLTSFTIMIPEPSIVALGMLGGIGLLLALWFVRFLYQRRIFLRL